MEKETFEIVIKVLAEKIRLLEWQLKDSDERRWKLKDEVSELIAENEKLKRVIVELEEEENEHI